ncbi:hypothetical protein, partial [Atlantibacter hermannii]|uniref:hypothetical protein n=1 Tax=Atlantibacter hermannii TaxID=565 RepID=UPI002FF698E3
KEQLRRGFQLTVARWRILRFPLSESTLNFRIFLFHRRRYFVMLFTCSVSMEAHYREFFWHRNRKMTEK